VYEAASWLPDGYYLEEEADTFVLRRSDGTAAAYFSTQGASKEAIEKAAEVDHRKSEEEYKKRAEEEAHL
jgi:hypothetical protein